MAGRMSRGVVGSAVLATAITTTGCVGEADEESTTANQERPTAAVPDKDSFSLSFENLSLASALTTDGIENEITVRLSDNLNNRIIPDGTRVHFTTNSGSIDPFCETQDSSCSVTWTSGGERPTVGPAADDPTNNPPDAGCGTVRTASPPGVSCPRPHRVKVLAWVEGQETFTDLNANGLFDDGDDFDTQGPNADDLPEAFRDDNENGVRDAGEVFVDYPCGISTQCGSSATYDQADGLYSGPDCAHSSLCANQQRLFVFENGTFALPADTYFVEFTDCNGNAQSGPLSATAGGTTYCWIAYDVVGNPLPAGTTVSYEASELDSVVGPESYGNTNQVIRRQFTLFADDDSNTGNLKVTFTPPEGAATPASIGTVD